MAQKHTIIKGAFILTLTGFATRFIGFFYRIFLSQTFGEEGVGLYQLIFPIYALSFSLTAAGIETAISRCVASKMSLGKPSQAKQILYTGLSISVILSCIVAVVLQKNAGFIATEFLSEDRCTPLLVVLSYALPFAAVHSCICGYYFGLKQTSIPAVSQLLEQLIRVLSVYVLYLIFMKESMAVSIIIAVVGLVAGEIVSSFFCVQAILGKKHRKIPLHINYRKYMASFREILGLSVPLTGNRVLLNLLQSIEAVSIPLRLQIFGFSVSDSLSIYGVLTGMALPCILFPSAITNSIATMMLPTVAEVQTLDNKKEMRSIIQKVSFCCFALGLFCCFLLLFFGNFIGRSFFHSEMAGQFIITLSWMCPFLYTNSNLISIINGLGKTTLSFVFNTLGLLIRIGSVFYMIPLFGVRGYLWGLLASQIIVFIMCSLYLLRYVANNKSTLL